MTDDHLPLLALRQPLDSITHQSRRQTHEGAGGHRLNRLLDEQINQGRFQFGLLGAVDEVDAEGLRTKPLF